MQSTLNPESPTKLLLRRDSPRWVQLWQTKVREGVARHCAVLVLGALLLFLLHRSWQKWPDPWVDFGREAYLAWQISEGRIFQKDITHLFGPLSGHWNALLCKAFGCHLDTLFYANIALLLLLLWLNYKILRGFASAAQAAMASALFITVLGFNQLMYLGNFNYVAPYSHELTHGLLLSLAALSFSHQARTGGRALHFFITGVCLGGVLLTKTEICLALLAALLVSMLLPARVPDKPAIATAARPRQLALILAGAAVAPAFFFVFFLFRAGLSAGLRALCGPLSNALNPASRSYRMYVWSAGLDQPLRNILIAAGYAVSILGALAFLVVAIPAALRFVRSLWAVRVLQVGIPVLCAALFYRFVEGLVMARALPLLVMAALTLALRDYLRERDLSRLLALAYTLFSLAMLSKTFLYARFDGYGFALSAAALMVCCVAMLEWIPSLFDSGIEGAKGIFRLAVIGFMAGLALQILNLSGSWFSSRTLPVGDGRDRFISDPSRGQALKEALAAVERLVPVDSTVTVLPEGQMLNFLARRRSAVPYLHLLPLDLELFGPSSVLESFQAAPPDAIVIHHRPMPEHGGKRFGEDYGLELMAWIRSNYYVIYRLEGSGASLYETGFILLRRN